MQEYRWLPANLFVLGGIPNCSGKLGNTFRSLHVASVAVPRFVAEDVRSFPRSISVISTMDSPSGQVIESQPEARVEGVGPHIRAEKLPTGKTGNSITGISTSDI